MNQILQDIEPSQSSNRDMLVGKEMLDRERHSSLYRLFHTAAPVETENGLILEDGSGFLLFEESDYIQEE